MADDHPLWRQTLRDLLEYDGRCEIVAEAEDGGTAIAATERCAPDVVVMDLELPVIDGVEATRRIVALYGTPVLILSGVAERTRILDATRAGAAGYILKTAAAKEIRDAVERVHAGGLVFDPELAAVVLDVLRGGRGSPGSSGVRVAVAAADAIDREGLSRMLDDGGFHVVVQEDVDAAIRLLDAGDVDVVVVDVRRRPAPPGLIGTRRVLVVADEPNVETVVLGADAPAGGFLLRSSLATSDRLLDAVRRVADGQVVLDGALTQQLLRRAPVDELSERELAVLTLMAEGYSNQGIAEHLVVSHKTVESHVAAVFAKLGLSADPSIHRRVKAVLAYLGGDVASRR